MPELKKTTSLILLIMLIHKLAIAQTKAVDFMQNIGKIYAVVAVIVLIFIGIILFLIYLERRVSKMENQIINKRNK